MQADQISYYQEYGRCRRGRNVEVNRDGRRLIADQMSYDTQDDNFSVDLLRTGEWPFYVSSASAGGSGETIEMEASTFYYGDPGPSTLSATSQSASFNQQADTVSLEKTTFRLGKLPVFYLPKYTHYLDEAPYRIELGAGYDDELGATYRPPPSSL